MDGATCTLETSSNSSDSTHRDVHSEFDRGFAKVPRLRRPQFGVQHELRADGAGCGADRPRFDADASGFDAGRDKPAGVLRGDIAAHTVDQIVANARGKRTVDQDGLEIDDRTGGHCGLGQFLRGLAEPRIDVAR